jgi:two-component system LytT family sensor kinase
MSAADIATGDMPFGAEFARFEVMLGFERHDKEAEDSVFARAIRHPGVVRWGAHILFWLFYLIVRSAAAAAEPPDEYSTFPFMLNRILVVATYCVGTGVLLALIAGPMAQRSDRLRNILLIVGAMAIAPLTQYGEQFWPHHLANMPFESYPFIGYFFMFGWVLPLWGFTQAVLGYHFQTIAQQRAVARAQSLAYDAQLRMLHYQINPHFLFNTLNAISTLVLDKRTEQAESMLMRLSGFLRYSLDRHPSELAPLSAELEAQRKYLEIEQTRFGEKLSVHFEIEPGLERVTLPSLILQPILENAIKYAITPSAEGGRIEVSAKRDGNVLRIRIDDDGPGLSPIPPRRRGVGLANARERLTLIYGEKAGLDVTNRQPRGCRVEIYLPIEEQKLARTFAPSLS